MTANSADQFFSAEPDFLQNMLFFYIFYVVDPLFVLRYIS